MARFHWDADMDELLIEEYKKNGPAWRKLHKEFFARANVMISEDAIRNRYQRLVFGTPAPRVVPQNRFRKSRTAWTRDEDTKLIHLFLEFKGKWSLISQKFVGRGAQSLRNRMTRLVNGNLKSFPDVFISNPQSVELILSHITM